MFEWHLSTRMSLLSKDCQYFPEYFVEHIKTLPGIPKMRKSLNILKFSYRTHSYLPTCFDILHDDKFFCRTNLRFSEPKQGMFSMQLLVDLRHTYIKCNCGKAIDHLDYISLFNPLSARAVLWAFF